MYHTLCHSHEKPRQVNDRQVYLGRLLLEGIFFGSYDHAIHDDTDDFAFTHHIVETLLWQNTSRDRLLAAYTLGMEQYLCARNPDRLRLPVLPNQAADQWRRMLWSELDERLRRTLGFKLDVVRSELHQQAAVLTPELHQLAEELHLVGEEFPRAAGRLTERGIDFEVPEDLLFPPDQEPIRYPGYG